MRIHSPKELAKALKSSRKRQRISQQRICELTGLKQATVSAFENRPEATKLDTLFRILAATNQEIEIISKHQEGARNVWSEEW